MDNFGGLDWLIATTGVTPVQPLTVHSRFGNSRSTVATADRRRVETYPKAMRPDPTVEGHLVFAFRYEPIHLEFLARMFCEMDAGIFESRIRSEPTGQYARRAGFFYEWLTGRRLDVPDAVAGNYVDAVDPGQYLTAQRAVNNQRWRVRDNLPGTREFCPVVDYCDESVMVADKNRATCAVHTLSPCPGSLSAIASGLPLEGDRRLDHDVLRRDGAVPAPFILPISATITNNSRERVGYDHALEAFSKPLMQRFGDRCDFSTEIECEDGVRTNFRFDAYAEAMPAWRYPDLTHHAEYVGHVVRMTIEDEMTNEATYLRNLERARAAVKNRLEGPDADVDAIIRSLQQNGWQLSGSLKKRFPQLEESRLAKLIIEDLRAVFEPGVS